MESQTTNKISLNEIRIGATIPLYCCTEKDFLNETDEAMYIAQWMGFRPHGHELRLYINGREYPDIKNARASITREKLDHIKYCLDLDKALYNENNNLPDSEIS